jgi:mRNA-degrading endonuclease RelE of RelBE toxin-antitoxin system
MGDYRVVYQLDDQAGVVTIAFVGHRRDVYRGIR